VRSRPRLGGLFQVAEEEAVSLDDLTEIDVDGRAKFGTVPDEGVEFTVLAAGINPRGERVE
jgi:hypothetical protein